MIWKLVVPVLVALVAVGSASFVGGLMETHVNDSGAQEALNFAIVEHNRRRNDMYLSKPVNVVKVLSQVVAGMKYVITVDMARTSCRKNGPDDVCTTHTDPELAKPYQCTFTVWTRSWISDIQLVKETCGE